VLRQLPDLHVSMRRVALEITSRQALMLPVTTSLVAVALGSTARAACLASLRLRPLCVSSVNQGGVQLPCLGEGVLDCGLLVLTQLRKDGRLYHLDVLGVHVALRHLRKTEVTVADQLVGEGPGDPFDVERCAAVLKHAVVLVVEDVCDIAVVLGGSWIGAVPRLVAETPRKFGQLVSVSLRPSCTGGIRSRPGASLADSTERCVRSVRQS
jgi:hypothetical protein